MTAGQLRGEIRQDVAEHVGGDDHVEALRGAHHMRHHGIDDEIVDRDAGEGARDLAALLEKQTIAELQHIGLVHDADVLAAVCGELERRLVRCGRSTRA